MSGSISSNPFDSNRVLQVLPSLPSFEEALARMLYLVEYRRPCGVLLGSPGTGTSALLEVLRREIATATCVPLSIDLQTLSGTATPWSLASGMGLSPQSDASPDLLWRLIEDRLEGGAATGVSYIPLIDHVQHADAGACSEISRCCRLMARTENTLLLVGHPPLPHDLTRVVQGQCDLLIELPCWTLEESVMFVTQITDHVDGPRFADEALCVIQTCTGGRFRDLMQICRLAWFTADVEGMNVIETSLIHMIAGEIWRPPTHPPMQFFPAPNTIRSNPATSIVPSFSAIGQ